MSNFRAVAAYTSDTHPSISAHRADRDETILVQLGATDNGETHVRIYANTPNNIRVTLNDQEKQ